MSDGGGGGGSAGEGRASDGPAGGLRDDPMRVLVIGAGGLGSLVGAVLARAGHDVTLLARGAHADAVASGGLRVTGPEGSFVARPRVVRADAPAGPTNGPPADQTLAERNTADVVFVAVKAYSLDEVAPMVVRLARAGSVVVPLLNGVDVTERLAKAGAPPDRLVDGLAYLTAFRTAPGEIERKGAHQRLVVGSATEASTRHLGRIEALFAGTPVEVVRAEDIRMELWMKMAVVCTLAAICGMTGSELGSIRAHPLGNALQARATHEVLAVGRSQGVALAKDAEARTSRVIDAFPADFYPSVLHDLRQGRRTEMDALCGTLTRMGRASGVETPLLDAATLTVALTEERRA